MTSPNHPYMQKAFEEAQALYQPPKEPEQFFEIKFGTERHSLPLSGFTMRADIRFEDGKPVEDAPKGSGGPSR